VKTSSDKLIDNDKAKKRIKPIYGLDALRQMQIIVIAAKLCVLRLSEQQISPGVL
jgi:hypothetical protein